ncbi:MAG: hypothetical protein JSU77_10510 [Fidelibacterota bacterium]|nr:MAG: hypothetical protein JSU77_10510 [Candidatus Neomarinimicrobiota bacterium]
MRLMPAYQAEKIFVRGAREHNLKDIDVEIPRNQLVVITGLVGFLGEYGLEAPSTAG